MKATLVIFAALALVEAWHLPSIRSGTTARLRASSFSPTLLGGLADLADDYDVFLVDQWGVLFDGSKPYEGSIACLKEMRAAGKKVVRQLIIGL